MQLNNEKLNFFRIQCAIVAHDKDKVLLKYTTKAEYYKKGKVNELNSAQVPSLTSELAAMASNIYHDSGETAEDTGI